MLQDFFSQLIKCCFVLWQPMPPVRDSSSGNATYCAECKAQSLKWMCQGLNTDTDIPVGVGGVSKISGGKQMQHHSNVLVVGLEGSAARLATARASAFWIKLLESYQNASRKINFCPRMSDGWWALKFLFIKKTNPNKPNQIKHLSLSASPLAAFYFAVAQDPTPCMLWWKMSLILREDNYCFQCCLEHLISCSIQMKQTAFTK